MTSKKDTLYQRAQQLYDKIANLNDARVLNQFKVKYSSLEETKKEFEAIIDEINLTNLKLDDTYTPQFQELNAFDDLYCHIQYAAKRAFAEAEPVNTNARVAHVTPRLPKIELIEFNGDPLNWPRFYETFKSLVHENAELDNVSKMHYLLSKLTQKALSVSAGLLPTAENYPILWNALIEKYEDKRMLAGIYLSQILEFKPIRHVIFPLMSDLPKP